MNKNRTLNLFAKLAAIYGNLWSSQFADIATEELIVSTWDDELKNYSDEEISLALKKCINENEMPPTLPKFLSLMKKDKKLKAQEAWMQVYEAIKCIGSYDNPNFEDENILPVIHLMGGWQRICKVLESEIVFRKREFLDIYNSISENNSYKENKLLASSGLTKLNLVNT
jgi:hypothetical protein